jgi:hypothetical protein
MELHFKHDAVTTEQEEDRSRSSIDEPWKRPAPEALDYSITQAASLTYPKPFEVLMRDVEYDYGACNMRTVQRRLRSLVERGHILRIDLGRRLYAYLRPGSNMVDDVDMLREQVESMMSYDQAAI